MQVNALSGSAVLEPQVVWRCGDDVGPFLLLAALRMGVGTRGPVERSVAVAVAVIGVGYVQIVSVE